MTDPIAQLRTVLAKVQYSGEAGGCPDCGGRPHMAHCDLAAALALVSPPPDEPPPCDGCVRGLRTFRRGPNADTERWHRDDKGEFICSGSFANWNTMAENADYCSREMHANSIRGVEGCFTAKEWDAASAEMHEGGNSSWIGVVSIAVRNLRTAPPDEPEAHPREDTPGVCDCGAKATQCDSCAVGDWQAAHPHCEACCPPEAVRPCANCGETGHVARNCSNANRAGGD